jgi:hypothetical protein
LKSHKYGSMVLCMKTTLELPDQLLITAKKRAAEMRLPLRALIEDGLRTRLHIAARSERPKRKIHWITVKGGLPVGLSLADRAAMRDWMCSKS